MAAAPQLAPIPGFSASYPFRASAAASAFGAAAKRRPLRATDEASDDRPVVLVVEPDERTRSLLHAGLSRSGFDVVVAASGEEALRFLTPDRALPAIVFAEADLRGGDGFALCQQIRADQRTADLPVVLLSRTVEAWHREMAGGAGADQYLPKPLYLNDVVALARLMAGRSSSEARFEADTATLPVAHALRALLSGVRAGRIELARERSWIAFREGRVVDCAFEGHRGEEALTRMLLLGAGAYTVTFGPGLARATMAYDLETLVRRMLPRLARWQKLVEVSVPLEAALVVDFAKLKDVLNGLPDEVNGVLRLFDGRRQVRHVVSESTMDEVMALEVVTRLYAMEILTPAPTADGEQVISSAPTFFEPTVAPAAEVNAAVSVFEATGTLEPELLKQLEAFRIKTVVEPREQVAADVAAKDVPYDASVMTMTAPESSADASAMEDDVTPTARPRAELSVAAATPTELVASELPTPDASLKASEDSLAAAFANAEVNLPKVTPAIVDSAAEPVAPSAELVGFVRAVEPAALAAASGSPSIASVLEARADVEEDFFSKGEESLAADAPIHAENAQPGAGWMPKAVVGLGLAAIVAVVAVIAWPSSTPTTATVTPVDAKPSVAVKPAQADVEPSPVVPAIALESPKSGAVAPVASAPVAAAVPLAAPTAAKTVSVDGLSGAPESVEVDLIDGSTTALAQATSLYDGHKLKDAIALLDEVTQADPHVAAAWLLLGVAKYDRGDASGAERAAMKTLALEPKNGRALVLLASVYLDQGQEQKAKVELKRYLELYPKGPFATEARQLLAQ